MKKKAATSKRELEKDLAVLADRISARVRLFRQTSKTCAQHAKKAIDAGHVRDVYYQLTLRDGYDAAAFELETIRDELKELLEHHEDR